MVSKQYSDIGVFEQKDLARGKKDFAGEANRKYESQFGRKELTSALSTLFSRFYHRFIFSSCWVLYAHCATLALELDAS